MTVDLVQSTLSGKPMAWGLGKTTLIHPTWLPSTRVLLNITTGTSFYLFIEKPYTPRLGSTHSVWGPGQGRRSTAYAELTVSFQKSRKAAAQSC